MEILKVFDKKNVNFLCDPSQNQKKDKTMKTQQRPDLQTLLSVKVRILLYLRSLSSLLFIQTYCSNICPFIDGLSFSAITRNLIIIFALHIIFREVLYYKYRSPWKDISLPRQGYYLSLISWALAGIFAMSLHAFLYTDFPFGSHIKLLSSYILIGGGILAQMEYAFLQREYRILHAEMPFYNHFTEKLTWRIQEGFVLFTLVPSLTMILVILRYDEDGVFPHHITSEVLYIGLLCILSSIFVSILIGKMLKEDTSTIVNSIQKIQSGDLTVRVPITRSDELGEISQGITEMLDGLRMRDRIREAFGKFVDPNVAQHFIENYTETNKDVILGGQRTHVVILMCDIRNFTPLTEELEAQKLVSLLNEYFSEMVKSIQHHNGIVDKFIGDSIMGIFGLSGEHDHRKYAEDAITAALEMQKKIEDLNRAFTSDGLPTLSSGIGIHQGSVIAGYIGSKDRLEYTVIGAPVNIAARIESLARDSMPKILFTQEIADEIKEKYPAKEIGLYELKGVSEPVKIYSVAN